MVEYVIIHKIKYSYKVAKSPWGQVLAGTGAKHQYLRSPELLHRVETVPQLLLKHHRPPSSPPIIRDLRIRSNVHLNFVIINPFQPFKLVLSSP